MKKKFVFVRLFTLFLVVVFVSSCASWFNDENLSEEQIQELLIQKNNKAKEIREKSISYALLRSESISIEPMDLFGSSSPLIVRGKEIPAMEARINAFTSEVENFIKNVSPQVARKYADALSTDLITIENYHLLDGVNDAYCNYLLSKYEKEIKGSIRGVVEAVREAPFYNQYSSIYKTYEAWRLNTNNLSSITLIQTFPPIIEGDIEEIITSIIYDKWEKEIKLGEYIAKAEGGSYE